MEVMSIQDYKNAFAQNSGFLHLNNAGIAPWPIKTQLTISDWSLRLSRDGSHAIADVFPESEKTRPRLAGLLGTRPEQIAFFQTCATAISQVALGLKFSPGDEIVVWDQEYPSNFYPWKVAAERSGAKLVIAKSTPELGTPNENLEAVVTSKTKVITVSWVQYRTGAITDLKRLSEFARARGIFTCIDAIQGLGALPFNFDDLKLDAVCGGAHKWFTSPLSLGFLVLQPEHVERLTPLSIGAITYGGTELLASEATPMAKGVSRFEPGGRSLLEMIGFGETLNLITQVGVASISKEANRLAVRLASGLSEKGYVVYSPHASGDRSLTGQILNFGPGEKSPLKSLPEIEDRLRSINASFAPRAPGIRLSPHAFNTDEHIDQVLDSL